MLSKSQVGLLKSLQQKKHRRENGLFLVEGYKSVIEFTSSHYQIEAIYHTPGFDPKVLNLSQKINLCEISVTDMERISNLKAPQQVLAAVKIPLKSAVEEGMLKNKFSLVLDGVQDPGNLGTIIRIADWFAIDDIICSEDTADAYNPKTVQASMGSLARINIYYTDIERFLNRCKLPVYGAVFNGTSVYDTDFGTEGLILFGSEGNGLSCGVGSLVNKPVTIPRIGHAESLNVGIAVAIICAELSRKSLK